MFEAFIRFNHVKKVYQAGEVAVTALYDASFVIERGEICVIVGESGAGKTTLLNILGGMDSLTDGSVTVDRREISSFSKRELTAYRRRDVGFVFQFYNLIPNLTALRMSRSRRSFLPVRWMRGVSWIRLDCETGRQTSPLSFPAANSSASPLPARWPRTPSCCSATSRPAPWTT